VTVTVADADVVDTGVFLRWFIDQDGFEHARDFHVLSYRLVVERDNAWIGRRRRLSHYLKQHRGTYYDRSSREEVTDPAEHPADSVGPRSTGCGRSVSR
jgi:hypothetical protein